MGLLQPNDEDFMRDAYREAEKAFEKDEIPVGAVIACNNQVIARAHNLTEQLKDVTAHAEMQAFTAASDYLGSKFLEECTLYVTLEPCPMCAGAAFWSRIGRLVYGAEDEKRGYTLYNENLLHPSTKVKSGVMANESKTLLQEFFRKKRK
ncbi:MAG: nucleoside deaminase [Bacteroidales bacterium]|nr:nucleoside deaminase [Bacteroidales bacterium]